ncbi:MAG TPA: hypothetical protein VFE90_08065 [Myxococcales bacterium]|nr:hypothetical protein [Myxococcales bacterium]
MRALSILLAALACACTAARPAGKQALPPACDVLPILGDVRPTAIAGDAEGGLAVVGTSRTGRVRAGSGDAAEARAFVLRIAPDGEVRWIRPVPGEHPLAVAFLHDEVVVAGEAQKRCFITRFSADGRQVWNVALGGENRSACNAIAADAGDDLWAAGSFSGTIGPVRSGGPADAFVIRGAGATGELKLVRAFGGAGTDSAAAIAVTSAGEVVVAGSFAGDVDPSQSAVDFGKGEIEGSGGTDGYVLTLSPAGVTRAMAIAGEAGDDAVGALATAGNGVFALATLHADSRNVACSGQVAVLRPGEWAHVFEGCLAGRGLTVDGEGRIWALVQAGKGLSALAIAPRDGALLGSRTWAQDGTTLRGAGIARVPGGFAIAGQTDGELIACGRPVGSSGELTGFVLWLRDIVR